VCGICGIVNRKAGMPAPDIPLLHRMIGRLQHRGPDESGFFRTNDAALGHARLSIIDAESGKQPLSTADGNLWISYNGELYNYLELRQELLSLGHEFRTHSDTEVFLNAFAEWGTDCFPRFNGQWAAAIWDVHDRRLVLSRDRFGIRPLYYTVANERFMFASEVKSLFADSSVLRQLDAAGLAETFTFWCPVAPATVFTGILQVRPGHFLVLDGRSNQRPVETPYWTLDFPDRRSTSVRSIDSYAEELHELLLRAVRLRFTRSDVPVGAYVSGGLDSSVAAILIREFTDVPLDTFSVRFSDGEFDEGRYQSRLVNRIGSEHHDIRVRPTDIGEHFPSAVRHAEQPILRTAPVPLFLLSRLVKEQGCKVVVTGEGADEVFAGYDIFREALVREFLARDPSSERRSEVLRALYPWMDRSPVRHAAMGGAFFTQNLDLNDPGMSHRPRWNTTARLLRFFTPAIREQMLQTDVVGRHISRLPADHAKWNLLSRAQWIESTTLLAGYILAPQGDRMLMAHSVEGRFPFLDHELSAFANALPSRHKIMGLDEKHLLKRTFGHLIPDEIVHRPKQPYRAPDAMSFFGVTSPEWFSDLLADSSVKSAGLFDATMIARLINKCQSHEGQNMSNSDNMLLVGIASTSLLFEEFVRGGAAAADGPLPPLAVAVDFSSRR
jgi:asparagine synthase (glutamine-hydrolysing)